MTLKKQLGKAKQQYNRGSSWINMPVQVIGIIAILLRLFQDTITASGFPAGYMWLLYAAIAPAYVAGCYVLGAVDDRFGIWRDENDYSWHVTPIAMKLCRKVDAIARHLGIEDGEK
jgi:hypothetical protein